MVPLHGPTCNPALSGTLSYVIMHALPSIYLYTAMKLGTLIYEYVWTTHKASYMHFTRQFHSDIIFVMKLGHGSAPPPPPPPLLITYSPSSSTFPNAHRRSWKQPNRSFLGASLALGPYVLRTMEVDLPLGRLYHNIVASLLHIVIMSNWVLSLHFLLQLSRYVLYRPS